MLRNSKLIHRLSLEQKISLILSSKLYQSSSVEGYTFPDFSLSMEPIMGQTNFKSTVYPKNSELAKTWNRKLIEEIARLEGEENNILSKNPIFKFNSLVGRSNISLDPYLTGDFIYHYFKGLSNSLSSSCYELMDSDEPVMIKKELLEMPDRISLSKGLMDFILVENYSDMVDIIENNNKCSNKVFFSKAKTKEELVRFISKGIYINFFVGDNYEEAFSYVKEAVELGTSSLAKLQNRLIKESDYNTLFNSGAIIPEEVLDKACDDYITLLLKLDENQKKSIAENKYVSDINNLPFDYKKHHKLALDAAREAVVMLKNESNTLPISSTKKVALIGDAAQNSEYYQEMFNGRIPTIFQTPYQIIHNYLELDTLDYAHGYVKNQDLTDSLLTNVREVTKQADVVLYYMWADEKTHKIPENQLKVLDEIYKTKQIPIVGVVYANSSIDMSFDDKCSALLLVGNLGQTISEAVLDIVTGNAYPSGKLTYDILNVKDAESNIEKEEFLLPHYMEESSDVRYPFGYGLSYANIVYKKLDINEGGVDVTIENISKFDGTEVIELYVQKENSSKTLSHKQLRGYANVHINSYETLKVHIAFDDETFKCYIKEKNCFGIEGGTYQIMVGDSSKSIKLNGKLTLSKYVDKRYAYDQEVVRNEAKTVHEFESSLDKAKSIKVGLRAFISLFIVLWAFGIMFLLWRAVLYEPFVLNGTGNANVVNYSFYGIIGLSIVLLVFAIIYIVKSSKKKKALIREYQKSDISLANVVKYMKDFETTKKVVYDIKDDEELETAKSAVEDIAGIKEDTEEAYTSVVNSDGEELENNEETQEVDLEVEKEAEEEVIIDINSATLTPEEIAQQEEEEMRQMEELAMSSEGADEFQDYEETVKFDNNQSLSQVCDRFMTYAENRGLILELSSVRSVLSNLGSTHILFINSKLKELLYDFITILCDFFGDKSHINYANESFLTPFNLAWKKRDDGSYEKTDFVNDVYNACRFKNNLNIIPLRINTLDNFDKYFKDFINYSNSPSYDHYMKLNRTQRIRIPENLVFLITIEDDDYTEKMSKELSTASSSVELIMRRNDKAPAEFEQPETLSYQYFNDLIYEAKKNNFISEDNWKRIDNLEEEINQIEPFSIGNKFVLAAERYSSIFMDCGGDEVDALDSILAEKLVPIIKTLKMYKQDNGIKNMVSLFEKHFGEENIPKTKRALQSSLHQEY